MNIGFFGDSYVDLIWHEYPNHTETRDQKPWSYRVLDDLKSPIISSGKGGTNQYYAIHSWQNSLRKLDYAIFTFTWENRMYSERTDIQQIMSGHAELRDGNSADQELINNVNTSLSLYNKYLHSKEQTKFLYTLMTKWILDLPNQYPDIKFIFLPNTEFARQILLEKFDKGVLVNMTFEALSNHETDSPGIMPINCGRIGHLCDTNHEAMASLIKDIIINYDTYKNKIINPDLRNFDLSSIPEFNSVPASNNLT